MKPTPLKIAQLHNMIIFRNPRRSTTRTATRRLFIGLATLAAITAALATIARS